MLDPGRGQMPMMGGLSSAPPRAPWAIESIDQLVGMTARCGTTPAAFGESCLASR